MPNLSGPTVFALAMLLSTSMTMKSDLSYSMRRIDGRVDSDACYVLCFLVRMHGSAFSVLNLTFYIHKLRALDYDGRFSGVFRQSEHDLIISYCNFRLQVLVLLTYSMRRVLPQVLVCERDALLFGTEAHVGNETTNDSLSPGMIMTFLLPLKMTESPNHRGSRSPLMQARRKLNMEKKETGGSSPAPSAIKQRMMSQHRLVFPTCRGWRV
jgi:hypothetical protein